MRSPRLLTHAVIVTMLALAASLTANNVVVLPSFTGGATGAALVFSGSPLSQIGTFTASADSYIVFARPTGQASAVRYYVLARGGSNSLIRLDAAFQPMGQAISLGQNVTAAAITPDGRRLLVIAGNLRMYNNDTDTEVQFPFLDVGLTPTDIVVSADSRRAFVMSPAAQRITCIDLELNQSCGQVPLPGISSGSASIGANGMVYVSAENRVLEIDPRGTPFDSTAVRRQFQLPGARVGKLVFTPDSTRALAVNAAPQSGQLLFLFDLNFVNSGVASISANEPSFNGFVFDKVFVVGNSRAYITTTPTSANPRRLYDVTIPDSPGVGSQISAPTVQEAFFGSLGNVAIADTIASSGEYPQANRMFVSAPLNLLTPQAQNTLYTVAFGGPQPNVTGQLTLNFLPGPVQFTGPAATVPPESVGGLARINASQPSTVTGGRTLPFGIRLLSSSGRPLFNLPIVFTATTPGVTLEGTATVFTNSDGIAMLSARAPSTVGDFTINASVSGTGLSTSFTFQAGAGGGGGGGGGTGQESIIVFEGDGQVIREGNPSLKPIRIRVVNAAGQGVPNVTVQWAVTQGGGRFEEGTAGETTDRRTTITNARGETQNTFRGADSVGLSASFQSSVMTVSTPAASATIFATTVLNISGGFFAPLPNVTFLKPVDEPRSVIGKAGQTISAAIQIQFSISSGPQFGQVLPNVGVFPTTGNDPASGPVVACVPKPVVLSNEQGIATCDLKLSGKAGTGQIRVDAGGYSDQLINLRVDPGEPGNLRITSGNNQSAKINERLPGALQVQLDDGGGNFLPGANIRWEVIQGQATLDNSTTVTDTNGRAQNGIRLGASPGQVLVRATAIGGSQPSVTFDLRVDITLAGLVRVSGDGQTTFTNTAFAQALVVRVTDTQGRPVPGQTVNFQVASGSGTLSASSATTGPDGQTSVQARAGAGAGPIQIRATVTGLSGAEVTFNLTAQLPGPQINALDFFNAASGERGAVVPGGVYRIVGSGIAPDLRGCVEGVPFIGMLPTRVNGVEVQFGTSLSPVFNVCNESGRESVTIQVPVELAPGGQVAVTVRVGAGSSVINGVQVIDLQPGTFETTDAQGRRYAVALRPNGTFITPENPGRYRDVIRFFITSAGGATPAIQTGVTGIPGQNIIAPVIIGINDTGVRIVSATYAVGQVGIYEIAAEIPDGTATGPARPLGILLTRPNGQFVFPGNSPTIAIAAQ